jgi:hypothetical protein
MSDLKLTAEETAFIIQQRSDAAAEAEAIKSGTAVSMAELDRDDLTPADMQRIGQAILKAMQRE